MLLLLNMVKVAHKRTSATLSVPTRATDYLAVVVFASTCFIPKQDKPAMLKILVCRPVSIIISLIPKNLLHLTYVIGDTFLL